MTGNTQDGRTENIDVSMKRLDWGIIASLSMSAASLLFTGGVVYGQVQAHDVRIVNVERRADAQDLNTVMIKESLAEIKTSLNYIADRAREDRSKMEGTKR